LKRNISASEWRAYSEARLLLWQFCVKHLPNAAMTIAVAAIIYSVDLRYMMLQPRNSWRSGKVHWPGEAPDSNDTGMAHIRGKERHVGG